MNTPHVSESEQAAAYLAWKRGATIEGWFGLGWSEIQGDATRQLPWDITLRRKPAPKFRAWKSAAEVPVGAIARHKNTKNRYMIVGATDELVFMGRGASDFPMATVLEWYDIEDGAVLKPCGVLES